MKMKWKAVHRYDLARIYDENGKEIDNTYGATADRVVKAHNKYIQAAYEAGVKKGDAR